MNVRLPAGPWTFIVHCVKTNCGFHTASWRIDTKDPLPTSKAAGAEADHYTHLIATSKNQLNNIAPPPYVFLTWCVVEHCQI
jgi:hypothetical protein